MSGGSEAESLRQETMRCKSPWRHMVQRISFAIPLGVLAPPKDFLSVRVPASGNEMPECPAQNHRLLDRRPHGPAVLRRGALPRRTRGAAGSRLSDGLSS